MQTLNKWTLRCVFILLALTDVVLVVASAYGVLWYNHENALVILPLGILITATSLFGVYTTEVKRRSSRQQWGGVVFFAILLTLVTSSAIFRMPPMMELGYLITCFMALGFLFYFVFEQVGEFWWSPSWNRLIGRLAGL